MTQQMINIGTAEVAGDGESIRSAFDKINTNFSELYSDSAALLVSDTAPVSPAAGDLWYDTVSGRTYVYYDNSWVDSAPPLEAIIADTPATNHVYVNPWLVNQDYVPTGSISKPFKTIAAAQTAIDALISSGDILPAINNPIFIILQGSIKEDVVLSKGHIFLVGQNGSIHAPIHLEGKITVDATSTSISDNYFSIQGITITVSYGYNAGIYFTGSNPQYLQLQDIGLIASGSSAGLLMDNTGAIGGGWSTCHGNNIKMTHNGTGDVYCIDIRHGTANFWNLETSFNGAEQCATVSNGATLTMYDSLLEAQGEVVVESYDGGYLTLVNCRISNINTNVDSYGIWLHNSGCTAVLIDCYFSIYGSTFNSRAIHGVSGTVVHHAGTVFAPSTNRRIDTAVSLNALSTSFSAV